MKKRLSERHACGMGVGISADTSAASPGRAALTANKLAFLSDHIMRPENQLSVNRK